MPIEIQYQPSAGVIGGASFDIGRGKRYERHADRRFKYDQLAQQQRMAREQIAASERMASFDAKQKERQMVAQHQMNIAGKNQAHVLGHARLWEAANVEVKQAQAELNAKGKAKQEEFNRRREAANKAFNTDKLIDESQYEFIMRDIAADEAGLDQPMYLQDPEFMRRQQEQGHSILDDGTHVFTDPETGKVTPYSGSRSALPPGGAEEYINRRTFTGEDGTEYTIDSTGNIGPSPRQENIWKNEAVENEAQREQDKQDRLDRVERRRKYDTEITEWRADDRNRLKERRTTVRDAQKDEREQIKAENDAGYSGGSLIAAVPAAEAQTRITQAGKDAGDSFDQSWPARDKPIYPAPEAAEARPREDPTPLEPRRGGPSGGGPGQQDEMPPTPVPLPQGGEGGGPTPAELPQGGEGGGPTPVPLPQGGGQPVSSTVVWAGREFDIPLSGKWQGRIASATDEELPDYAENLGLLPETPREVIRLAQRARNLVSEHGTPKVDQWRDPADQREMKDIYSQVMTWRSGS